MNYSLVKQNIYVPAVSYKSTIITMFFDLTTLLDPITSTRDINFYLKNGRALLELEYPMIIFCDMKTKEKIKQIREECIGINNITIYIEKNISEYDYYKENWHIINENRNKYPSYKLERNKRATSSYFLTMMFKIYALNIAHKRNDFNTSHYFWMDFGCNHIVADVSLKSKAMLDNPNPKVSVVYIHYRYNELKSMIDFCNGGVCGIAGGVFSVEKEYISKFYTSMISIFYEQLSNGVGHSDEQVLTYCYNRNPELFTLSYGDYYSLITNYHYPVRDFGSIKRYFLEKTLAVGKIHLAVKAAKHVYESYEKKLLYLSTEDVTYIKSLIEKYPENNIYYFWIKSIEMHQMDIKYIENLKEITKCNIIVITNNNLKDYVLKDYPIHEAYEYLSDFHKLNYLKTYFMHLYGGGFFTNGAINDSWMEAFNDFNVNKKILINGYSESSSHDISVIELKKYYKLLVGNNAYIVRSGSEFTKMCFDLVNKLLSSKLELLRLYKQKEDNDENNYPIEHNEMLGSIFHMVQMEFITGIAYTVPKPI